LAERTFNGVNINITLKPQETRANLLSTPEDLAVQMGKIQKMYSDLTNEAFNGTSRNELLVVKQKEFSGMVASANNHDGACFYFGSVRQTTWDTPMLLRYRIRVWVPANENYRQSSDVEVQIFRGASSYKALNVITNGSYRPASYHYWGRLTATGYTAASGAYGNIVGVGLNDGANPTSASLPRSFHIEILEEKNCVFTFFDNAQKAASCPGYNTTNYSVTNGNFSSTALMPDNNQVDRLWVQERLRAGTNGAKQYSLVAINKDNRVESFTTSSGTGTDKTYYTGGKFRYKPSIFYYGKNGNTASGTVVDANVMYQALNNVDLRYSTKGVTTSAGFTQWSPVFLEVTFDSDWYWSVTSNGFTQTLRSGYYYIWIGQAISVYQVSLGVHHPIFYYNGTTLIDADAKIAQDIASSSIPSDNVTGTGESGKIAMFNGQHTITTGTVTTGTINSTTCDISDGVLSFTLTPNTAVTDISLDLSNN